MGREPSLKKQITDARKVTPRQMPETACYIDLETDGRNADCSITQFAAVRLKNGVPSTAPKDSLAIKVRPKAFEGLQKSDLTTEQKMALAYTRLKFDDIMNDTLPKADRYVPEAEAMRKISEFLGDGPLVLAGHNCRSFDVPRLLKRLAANELPGLNITRQIDTLELSKVAWPKPYFEKKVIEAEAAGMTEKAINKLKSGRGRHTLDAVMDRTGIDRSERDVKGHSAKLDVLLGAQTVAPIYRLARTQLNKLEQRGRSEGLVLPGVKGRSGARNNAAKTDATRRGRKTTRKTARTRRVPRTPMRRSDSGR